MDYRVAESLSPRGKQRRYRQRLSARGLVHVQGWVTPAPAEAIPQILAARGGDEPPTACGERVRRHAPRGEAGGAE
jgi:hypothetical protein